MNETMDIRMLDYFFHISTESKKDAILSFPGIELLDRERAREVLQLSGQIVKSHGLDLPASFLGMAHFGLAASLQLILAQYNRWIDLTLPNLQFELETHGDHVHFCFRILELRSEAAPAEQREAWVLERLTEYYRDQLVPLVTATAAAGEVKPELIWSQYGGRIRYALDYVLSNETNPIVRDRFQSDYKLLSTELPPELFGRKRNPFLHEPKYIPSAKDPEQMVMMRSACCLYFRREHGTKCYNCPRLLPEERAAMK